MGYAERPSSLIIISAPFSPIIMATIYLAYIFCINQENSMQISSLDSNELSGGLTSISRIATHILWHHTQIDNLQALSTINIQFFVNNTACVPRCHLASPQTMPWRFNFISNELFNRLIIFFTIRNVLDPCVIVLVIKRKISTSSC